MRYQYDEVKSNLGDPVALLISVSLPLHLQDLALDLAISPSRFRSQFKSHIKIQHRLYPISTSNYTPYHFCRHVHIARQPRTRLPSLLPPSIVAHMYRRIYKRLMSIVSIYNIGDRAHNFHIPVCGLLFHRATRSGPPCVDLQSNPDLIRTNELVAPVIVLALRSRCQEVSL
ncbi:hypothetical protein BDN70DRAFT_209730 [Pholiota conissans]|uniref:Uncharacterized protein n=1 Tax=Pholiota conissans TaxID=109636 RepID=A0A9P5YVC4_9AGAR|nr:hypothetical protein BDN70DRAFT_209730 [Pholiota conissans]